MASSSSESEILGLEAFFDEITKFLRESGCRLRNCFENYADYAVERLEICITNVSNLMDHLKNDIVLVQPAEYQSIVAQYKNNMESLVTCLRSLSEE